MTYGIGTGGSPANRAGKRPLHDLLLRQMARCTDDRGALDVQALLLLVDRVYRRNDSHQTETDSLLGRLSAEMTAVDNERRALQQHLAALTGQGMLSSTPPQRIVDTVALPADGTVPRTARVLAGHLQTQPAPFSR